MTISPAQIRAAISLLGLRVNHVCDELDLNVPNLTKYLNPKDTSKQDISKSTLDILNAYFSNKRIVFTHNDGVARKPPQDFEVLYGRQGFRTLMDDIYMTAGSIGGDIRIINGHPELFLQTLGADWYAMHVARMESVKDNIDFKIIAVRDGGEIAGTIADYRWIEPKEFFGNSIYIYGGTVASIYFDEDDVVIEIMNRQRLAQTWRHQFEIDWNYYGDR
ncbi:MAG: hypothetical protein ACRBCK_00390 [Alphaproteobacteria bacterium]